MDKHDIIAYVEKSRAEQGLPPRIVDPGALRQIAVLTIPPTTNEAKKRRRKAAPR